MLRCRLVYLLALVGAVLFYIFFNGYLSYFVLIFALVLPFLSLVLSLPGMCAMRAHVEIPLTAVVRKSPFPVQLIVENRTPFPMARARIRLRYSNTFSHEETSETVFMPVFVHSSSYCPFGTCLGILFYSRPGKRYLFHRKARRRSFRNFRSPSLSGGGSVAQHSLEAFFPHRRPHGQGVQPSYLQFRFNYDRSVW